MLLFSDLLSSFFTSVFYNIYIFNIFCLFYKRHTQFEPQKLLSKELNSFTNQQNAAVNCDFKIEIINLLLFYFSLITIAQTQLIKSQVRIPNVFLFLILWSKSKVILIYNDELINFIDKLSD